MWAVTSAHANDDSYLPILLAPSVDARAVQSYRSDPATRVIDAYETQLRDLVKTRAPDEELSADAIVDRVRTLLAGQSPGDHGTWVYYPWSRRLVHLLERDAFNELRSNRNRHKILAKEQDRLSECKIGIVGLSVGHAAATTLALEGIGGHFYLADFDVLDLSNLNRIRTGVHNLGVNKAVLAAREMFELNPYLNIRIFAEGVTTDNLDAFLGGERPLDLLVEECDDLFTKVRLRERARELRIPVIMDTSDGGLVDIERFDREPERELFHGVLPSLNADELKGLSTTEKIPFVLAILGLDQISTSLAGSLVELKKTLSTWPQLGSSVALGGALVAHSARNILLGHMEASGRFSVDLDQLISPQGAQTPTAMTGVPELPPECASLPAQPPPPANTELGRPLIEHLLEYAIRAPSGGNAQPWIFRWHQNALHCKVDPTRSSFLDVNFGASALALGAAIENIALAAQSLGYGTEIINNDRNAKSCSLAFASSPSETPELLPFVFARATNRHLGDGSVLSETERQGLISALDDSSASIELIEDRETLDRAGRLLGEIDKLRFLSPLMHSELMSELRWNPSTALATQDGIDLATLEMSAADRAVLHVLKRGDVMRWLDVAGLGEALGDPAHKGCQQASALALVSVPMGGLDMVAGGRAMQRVWLKATQLGLSVCPQGVAFFLLSRVNAKQTKGLRASEIETITRVSSELRELLSSPAQNQEVMLFRLSHTPAPSAFALRRSVDAVLDSELDDPELHH